MKKLQPGLRSTFTPPDTTQFSTGASETMLLCRFYTRMLMAGFMMATAVATGQAQNWLQWRGPNRDGVITAFSEPKTWPETLKLKWKIPVGIGHSSPVVLD